MSTVVDVASSGDDEDADGESTRDVFGESAIEVDDETLRRVSPGAWAGRVTKAPRRSRSPTYLRPMGNRRIRTHDIVTRYVIANSSIAAVATLMNPNSKTQIRQSPDDRPREQRGCTAFIASRTRGSPCEDDTPASNPSCSRSPSLIQEDDDTAT